MGQPTFFYVTITGENRNKLDVLIKPNELSLYLVLSLKNISWDLVLEFWYWRECSPFGLAGIYGCLVWDVWDGWEGSRTIPNRLPGILSVGNITEV